MNLRHIKITLLILYMGISIPACTLNNVDKCAGAPGDDSSTSTASGSGIVLGQADFNHGDANRTGTLGDVNKNTLYNPHDVALDPVSVPSRNLYVADTGNNRVLIWNNPAPTSGANADNVLGQSSFTARSANRGGSIAANTLSGPKGVSSSGSKFAIADTGNNRILIWNSLPTSDGEAADVVVGQTGFTTGSANQGGTATAQTLNAPTDVWIEDDSRLIIADSGNHRVLIWNSIPVANNVAANIVIGQANKTSSSKNRTNVTSPPTQNSLWNPTSIDYDGVGEFFIADSNNSRVLIYTTLPAADDPNASYVIGQENFITNTPNEPSNAPTRDNLDSPHDMFTNGTSVWISDSDNNRVVRHNTIPTTNGADADAQLGQTDFQDNEPNGTNGVAKFNVYNDPKGIYVDTDASNAVWIADSGNNRVVRYNNP